MTPDELVEAVARGMRDAWVKRSLRPTYAPVPWDDLGESDKETWLHDARAALRVVREAMREPDEVMMHAYYDVASHPVEEWRAMLAASPLGRIEE